MRIPFATRASHAPRGPRYGRPLTTLVTLLALEGREPTNLPIASRQGSRPRQPGGTARSLLVAMPEVPSMSTTMLQAMHQAGLLRTAATGRGIVVVAMPAPD